MIDQPPPHTNLGVRLQIVMPIGFKENLDLTRMQKGFIQNAASGEPTGRIALASIASVPEQKKRRIVLLVELLANRHGREFLAKRNRCVAQVHGAMVDGALHVESIVCGPEGNGYVCDVRLICDYR